MSDVGEIVASVRAYDGAADSLADDETRTRRGIDLPRLVRVRCTACT